MATFLRLLRYVRPHWPLLIVTFALLLLTVPASLFHPLVWMFIVDQVITAEQPQFVEYVGGSRYALLAAALGVMFSVYLLGALLGAVRSYVLSLVGQRFIFDLRRDLFRVLLDHSLPFFHSRSTGDLISRTMNDVDSLEQVAVRGIDEMVSNALQFMGVAAVIVWLNWRVGLMTLAPMIGVGILVRVFNARVRGLYRRVRDRLGDVTTKLQESLTGILVIKAFGEEQHEADQFERRNTEYFATSMKAVKARTIYFPAVQTVGFISNITMIGMGALEVIAGRFTIGGLIAYRGYWWQLFSPVSSLARINETIQRAIAAASRVFELMDEPIEIQDKPDAVELAHTHGHIEFRHVDFHYDTRDTTLTDMTFHARPGEQIGLVGPSGAGKSTLLALVLRLYDPQNGQVLIDGHDLRDVRQASLRQHFAVVTQEPFLFNDTVAGNILYGRPGATESQMIEAARQANAHDFIVDLPQGYDTIVGERGVKLSGGQKQRICIARALLADPRVLLLDEATASVEPESESIIQAALQRLLKGRTALIVSHRMSMVRDADRILVIRDGRITEHGSHDELMSQGGWYYRMYQLQAGTGNGDGSAA